MSSLFDWLHERAGSIMNRLNFADSCRRIKRGEFPETNEDYILLSIVGVILIVCSLLIDGIIIYIMIASFAALAAMAISRGYTINRNNTEGDHDAFGAPRISNTQLQAHNGQVVPVNNDEGAVKVLKQLANVIEDQRTNRGSTSQSCDNRASNYHAEPYQYPTNVEYPPDQMSKKSQLSILLSNLDEHLSRLNMNGNSPQPSRVTDSALAMGGPRNKPVDIEEGRGNAKQRMNNDQQLEQLSLTILKLCKNQENSRDEGSQSSSFQRNTPMTFNNNNTIKAIEPSVKTNITKTIPMPTPLATLTPTTTLSTTVMAKPKKTFTPNDFMKQTNLMHRESLQKRSTEEESLR